MFERIKGLPWRTLFIVAVLSSFIGLFVVMILQATWAKTARNAAKRAQIVAQDKLKEMPSIQEQSVPDAVKEEPTPPTPVKTKKGKGSKKKSKKQDVPQAAPVRQRSHSNANGAAFVSPSTDECGQARAYVDRVGIAQAISDARQKYRRADIDRIRKKCF